MSELTKRFQQSYAYKKTQAITNAESGVRVSFGARQLREEALQQIENMLAAREVRESRKR